MNRSLCSPDFARPANTGAHLFADPEHSPGKPREKAGGRYVADLFLQLPARRSGSAAILGTVCRSNRRADHCALGRPLRLYRNRRRTTDSIARRYRANIRREVRIYRIRIQPIIPRSIDHEVPQRRGSLKLWLVSCAINTVIRPVNLGLGNPTKSVITCHPRGIASGTPNRQTTGHWHLCGE